VVTSVDPQRVADLVREAAETIVMPWHRKLEDDDIREKRKGDLVTVADLEAERWLTARLADLVPGSAVVGEEAVFVDPGVMQWLRNDGPVWVVDPIDGTWNFAHGKDAFAVIVALRVAGETVMGWICEPATGAMAIGEHGAGVVLDAVPVDLADSGGPLYGTAARYLYDRASEAGPHIVAGVSRPSSAGHEYLLMLRGERQFSAYTRLLPWDHAAGSLLTTEAGGISRLLDGAPYDPVEPVGDLLNATSAKAWATLRDVLTPPV
jgi:fructose-1,6-bisphosphatase/inositol monophosphatase family enzyme